MNLLLMVAAFLFPEIAFAEGEHSHGIAGELEHALPVIGVLLALTVVGVIYNYKSKKKGE